MSICVCQYVLCLHCGESMNSRIFRNSALFIPKSLKFRHISHSGYEAIDKFNKSSETELARSIMAKYEGYIQWPGSRINFGDPKLLPARKRASRSNHSSLLSNFRLIVDTARLRNLCITSDIFQPTLTDILTKCAEFSSSELIEALDVFVKIPPTPAYLKSEIVNVLRNTIGSVCSLKCKNWSIEQLLYVCDMFTVTPVSNRTAFAHTACQKLAEKVDELTVKQLVQALFFLSWYRLIKVDRFEAPVTRHFGELSLDELSIAALGFVRTSTIIQSDELIEDIYAKLLREDLSCLDDISLTVIIKVLRISNQQKHRVHNSQLLKKLICDVRHRDLKACTHTALLAAKAHNCDDALMEVIVERFLSNIKSIRMKDMERVCFACIKLAFDSASRTDVKLFEAILTEMPNRTAELQKYPRVFAKCMRYLVLKEIPCQQLIKTVLSPEFLHSTYGTPENFDEEILFLDTYTRINLSDTYDGSQLSDQQRHVIASKFCAYNHIVEEWELFDTVKNIFRHVRWIHALPHFSKADIFLVIDRNRYCGVNRTECILKNELGKIITKDMIVEANNNLEVIVLLIQSPLQEIWKGRSVVRTGQFKCKLDQLTRLGFLPIVIGLDEWRATLPNERQQYIIKKINTRLQR